ncbi:MAG: hypothetical protein ABIH00_08755 [Armatimonadota bacterium]
MENSIWLYRLYDVAEDFNLNKVQETLAKVKQTSRLKFTRVKPKSIIIENPPVSANIASIDINLGRWSLKANLTAKVYNMGAISLILKIILPENISYNELKELSIYLYSAEETEEIFKNHLDNIKDLLSANFKFFERKFHIEDFTLYYFHSWNKDWDPAPILLAEKEPLSKQTTDETLHNSFSYGENDLTIITWDSALVCDKEKSTDIPDILEFALMELLELRYYDDMLSQAVDAMYEDVKKAGTFRWFLKLSRYREISKKLMHIVADISEITEKIQNSLKVTEDVFYARVYASALNIFRTQNWSNSIQHKISIIQRTYQMLSSEIENSNATFLEAAIVFLIIIEIIISLFLLH